MAEERITQATKDAEHADAKAEHGAPQVPTPEEAAAADSNGPTDPKVKETYEEYLETGAEVKGEGKLP